MGCGSLEEAIGVPDWQFQFMEKGYELQNWEGERKQRQKGIREYCSSCLAIFYQSMEQWVVGIHSWSVCLLWVHTNGAELAVLGQFRKGKRDLSLCVPSFLQGNEVSGWEGK